MLLSLPGVVVCAAVAVGVCVAEVGGGGALVWAGASAVAAAGLLWGRRGRAAWALLSLACSGAWAAAGVRAPPPGRWAQARGALWQVQVDAPVRQGGAVGGAPLQQTQARLVAEQVGARWCPRRGRVALLLEPSPAVGRGDVLLARLALRPLAAARPPRCLPPATLARRQQVGSRAQVLGAHALLRPGRGLVAAIDRRRAAAREVLRARLPAPQMALAQALALGDTAALTAAQRGAWADAGMAHLLAVSGLHVGLVGGALVALVRRLWPWVPRLGARLGAPRLAAAAALPGIAAYAALTGGAPAAQRAALMAGAALGGRLVGRPGAAGNGLGVAGALMLLARPLALFEASFTLSFAAVGALVWAVPRPADDFAEAPPARGLRPGAALRRLAGHLRRGLWAAWATGVATAPLTAAYFGRATLVGPLSNLLAIPLGALVATPLALLLALGGSLWPPLAAWLAQPTGRALAALDALAAAVARLPGASVDVPPPGPWALGATGLLLTLPAVWWAPWAPGRRRLRLGWAVGLAACAGGSACGQVRAARGDGHLTVRQLYVGQGDAAWITGPRGGTLVVDGGGAVREGGRDPGREVVAPLLRRAAVRRIDVMVLTHAHPDHLGGLHYLAEQWPVGALWLGEDSLPLPSVQALAAAVRRRGGAVHAVTGLRWPQRWEGVEIDLLWPRRRAPPRRRGRRPGSARNDGSVVLRLQHGHRSILLPGDIEVDTERQLVPLTRRTDIIKVAHHGSRTSSSAAWLAAAQPQLAVLSCGEDNRFGFPHPEVLQRFAAVGCPVWSTADAGVVRLRSDGARWEACGGGRCVVLEARGVTQ